MFTQASGSHSVHSQPHGYSVTVHPYYRVVGVHSTGMLSCLCVRSCESIKCAANYTK